MARVLVLALLTLAPYAFGWGAKGHEISARVAAKALPKDMPQFFLQAGERLAYLCPEPDRWRGPQEPVLDALNTADHYMDLEVWGDAPIPAGRYNLILAAIKRGIVSDTKPIANLGTVTAVIAELAERLTVHFRQWRETTEDTEAARQIRHQVEEGAIYTAGILGHFVTDIANPLHTTVHHNGWAQDYPNPRGYPGPRDSKGLHGRFESDFVEAAISEKDLKTTEPHRVGAWTPEAEKFIRRNNGFVEMLYDFDRSAAFGSGKESPEAKAFTAQRLSDGASMLRDVWYTAWMVSHDEWLNERITLYARGGSTVLELLKRQHRVETKTYPMGQMVTGIGNRKNGLEGHYWTYYINGAAAAESADKYVVKQGDRIEWRFVPQQ